MKQEELEEALLAAVEIAKQEGGSPENVYVEGYGWVIRNGHGTEAGAKWYKEKWLKTGDIPE